MEKNDVLNVLGVELYSTFKKFDVILAGGSIRGLYQQTKPKEVVENQNENVEQKDYTKEDAIKDLDIYFRSIDNFYNLRDDLLSLGYEEVFCSLNADTFKAEGKLPIQLIKLDYCMGEPEDIIRKFDFSICAGAFDFKTEEFVLDEHFENDNNKRKIRFNTNTQFPIASLIRINKYIAKKGYKVNSIELLKIALSINNLKMVDYRDLKAQLNGIDTSLLQPLTDTLMNGEKYDINAFLDKMNDYLESVWSDVDVVEQDDIDEI